MPVLAVREEGRRLADIVECGAALGCRSNRGLTRSSIRPGVKSEAMAGASSRHRSEARWRGASDWATAVRARSTDDGSVPEAKKAGAA